VRSDFIQGVGKVKGKFVLLLDVDRALSLDEIGDLGDLVAMPEGSASAFEPVPA
jgi:purine-binding chemotaxis protein CheW